MAGLTVNRAATSIQKQDEDNKPIPLQAKDPGLYSDPLKGSSPKEKCAEVKKGLLDLANGDNGPGMISAFVMDFVGLTPDVFKAKQAQMVANYNRDCGHLTGRLEIVKAPAMQRVIVNLQPAYAVSAEAVVRKASVVAAFKATGATLEEAAKPIMIIGAFGLACIAYSEGNAAPMARVLAMAR